MSATKTIAVIGATGVQGGSVVSTLVNDPSWKVRGITRNVHSASAQKLALQGVEVVSADLDDVSSLVAAFSGAQAIFSVTDTWGYMLDPSNDCKVKPGETKLQLTYQTELQRGKNVFDAAAKIEGLDRLVFSMLAGPKKWTEGKLRHAYHCDAKQEAADYGKEMYPELWAKTSLIQIGVYLSLHLPPGHPAFVAHRAEDGVVEFSFGLEYGDFGLPLIAAEVDTGPLVEALLKVEPGKNLVAYREWMSGDDFVATIGRVLGIQARRAHRTFGDLQAILGPEIAADLVDSFTFMRDYGYAANHDRTVLHPKDLGVSVRLGTVEDWIKKQDWSFILS